MKLGNFNCRAQTTAKCGRIKFNYDYTTKGMILSAIKAGVKIGDVVTTADGDKYQLYSEPKNNRCNGVWANRVW